MNRPLMRWKGAGCVWAFSLVACGGAQKRADGPVIKDANGATVQVDSKAKQGFDGALAKFLEHDKANDWASSTCVAVAKQFADASAENKSAVGKELSVAIYNAALSYQRCNSDSEAKKMFQHALTIDPKAHRAKVQIALYDYKEKGDGALESTISLLQQAVLDAEFQNPDALVNLAMLQMRRNGSGGGQGCKDDLDCAKKNIQRALAVDDSFMPAFNQLALYYFELARSKAGRKRAKAIVAGKRDKKVNNQQLELAALVCSQAIRKNPQYAPIHNTAGLIQVELSNINSAVQEFKTAAQLDAGFVEAQMNFAAVNLSFRGFKNAEDSYRQVLKLRPNDYDAILGLALSIRGQINDQNFEQNIKDAQVLLDRAKQVSPERAETYYNEGILTQEYKVKSIQDTKAQIPVYEKAKSIYTTFLQKAGANPDYADASKRASERIRDIDDTIKFIREGIKASEDDASKPVSDQPEGLEGPSGAGR